MKESLALNALNYAADAEGQKVRASHHHWTQLKFSAKTLLYPPEKSLLKSTEGRARQEKIRRLPLAITGAHHGQIPYCDPRST